MLSIIAGLACVAIFLFLQSQPEITDDVLARVGAPSEDQLWDGAYWGLVTSSFVHIEPLHLLMNLTWVWGLGIVVERRVGYRLWLVLFVGASIVGSGVQIAVSDTTGIGMSGVVYAWAGFAWIARRTDPVLGAAIERHTRVLLVWLVGCYFATRAGLVNIANGAHVGGLAFGLLAGHAWAGVSRQRLALRMAVALTVLAILPAMWAPWSGGWWYWRGYNAFAKQDFVFAREAFNIATARAPDRTDIRCMRGVLRAYFGELAAADADISAYLAEVDNFAYAFDARADVRARQGRWREALDDYDKSLGLQPAMSPYLGRGRVRHITGEDDGVIEDYRAALDQAFTEHERSDVLRFYLFTMSEREHHADAVAECDRLIGLHPDDLSLVLRRAEARERADDRAGAADDRRLVASRPADGGRALEMRIEARLGLNDLVAAMADADRLVSAALSDVDRARAHALRARVRVTADELAGARADFEEAFRRSPSYQWGLLMGSVIAAAVGDVAEGQRGVAQALALDAREADPALWQAALGGSTEPLVRHVQRNDRDGRLAKFYQGQLTAAQLIEEAQRTSGNWRKRQRVCTAHAFVGLAAERRGDRHAARGHYQAAVDSGDAHLIERAWSRQRLKSDDLR